MRRTTAAAIITRIHGNSAAAGIVTTIMSTTHGGMCVTRGVVCIVCVTLVVRLHESCRSLRLRNTHVHTPSGQSTPLSASAKHANVSFGFERLSPSHIPLTYVDVFAHTSVYGFEMVTDAIMTGSGMLVVGVGMLVVVLGMLVVVVCKTVIL